MVDRHRETYRCEPRYRCERLCDYSLSKERRSISWIHRSDRLYPIAAAVGVLIACNDASQPMPVTGGSQAGVIDAAVTPAGGANSGGGISGSGGASGSGGTVIVASGGNLAVHPIHRRQPRIALLK
jgi:hypothetical protein